MTINHTQFQLPDIRNFYRGKVREVYTIGSEHLVMIASDRISAFDVILPKQIPFKGQVLNQIAVKNLNATRDIVDNWLIESPHPNVCVGYRCEPIKIEMVVRGYLSGHAWRTYKSGGRSLCGVSLPEGMKEHQKFPKPIITPSTKADEGHDEDISAEEIIKTGLASKALWEELSTIALALFERGTQLAAKQGLILVDTKYEFGLRKGKIMLMDEIHTPDSSRYFYADTYQALQQEGKAQRQLSKEFVREWLMDNGFQGKDGQQVPEMTPEIVSMITNRYIELYEKLMGEPFHKNVESVQLHMIENAIKSALSKILV
jgi:phosphoribosylaminoimidazole-succinocarboxamide synthase